LLLCVCVFSAPETASVSGIREEGKQNNPSLLVRDPRARGNKHSS
jgi:hypothetical protein